MSGSAPAWFQNMAREFVAAPWPRACKRIHAQVARRTNNKPWSFVGCVLLPRHQSVSGCMAPHRRTSLCTRYDKGLFRLRASSASSCRTFRGMSLLTCDFFFDIFCLDRQFAGASFFMTGAPLCDERPHFIKARRAEFAAQEAGNRNAF